MSPIGLLLTINAQLTTVLSVLPNLLVIFLACSITVPEIRQYRWIIASQSALEILISGVLSILNPQLNGTPDGIFVLARGSIIKYHPLLCVVFFFALCALLVLSMLLLPLAFLYRYACICRNEVVSRLFTVRGSVLIALSYLALAVVIVIGLLDHGSIKKIINAAQQMGIPNKYSIITVVPYGRSLAIHHSVFDLLCWLALGVVIISSYAVITFCAIRTFSVLKSTQITERTKKMQKDFNYVMILQSLLPLVFMILPMMFLLMCMFFKLVVGEAASLIVVLFNWQPCAHPFLSLYFVAPFRRRILDLLHWNLCRAKGVQNGVLKRVAEYRSGNITRLAGTA